MKISAAYLTLLGLSSAHVLMVGRAPQSPPYKETPPGKQIGDAIKDGIKEWGPAGSLKPPEGGPKAPIKDLPGGVPKTPRPKSKSESTRLNKDGGNVQGNIKKPTNSWSNTPCWKRDGRCLYKSRHVQLKTGAKAAGGIAFAVLAPYARDVLEKIKEWPVIGQVVAWIDDVVTAIQEAIGGEPAETIHGNRLKLSIICAIRGHQEWANQVDRECQRMREDDEERKNIKDPEWVRAKWLEGLNQLLDACSKLETEHPEDEHLRIELEERCAELELKAHREQNPVVTADGYPKVEIGECACDPYNLPPEGDSCRNRCVSSYILAGRPLPPSLLNKGRESAKNPPSKAKPDAKPERQATATLASPEATPRPSRACGPPDDPNQCRGGQTLDEFYTGTKVCEICGFTWDQERNKCTTKEGYIKWPRQPSAGGESRPSCDVGISCGGGQTQAELGKGYDICTTCGFEWEVAVGGCSNEQGQLVWPQDGK